MAYWVEQITRDYVAEPEDDGHLGGLVTHHGEPSLQDGPTEGFVWHLHAPDGTECYRGRTLVFGWPEDLEELLTSPLDLHRDGDIPLEVRWRGRPAWTRSL